MRTLSLWITINWRWKSRKMYLKDKISCKTNPSWKPFSWAFSGSYFPLLYSNSSSKAPFFERMWDFKKLHLTYRISKVVMHPWKRGAHLDTGGLFSSLRSQQQRKCPVIKSSLYLNPEGLKCLPGKGQAVGFFFLPAFVKKIVVSTHLKTCPVKNRLQKQHVQLFPVES